jgi:hypothetical protein
VQDLSERAAKIRRAGSYRWVGIYEVTEVPIVRGGTVVGVLDVESDRTNGFGQDDRAHLQVAATVLATEWDG